MTFCCYKFPDEPTFLAAAAAEGLIATDENDAERLVTGGHGWALDVVGTIYEGGTYGANGEVVTPPVALSGWHVNTIGYAPPAWDQYLVVVNTPARIFAGCATQAPSSDILEQM